MEKNSTTSSVMSEIQTIKALIDLWPSRKILADEIGTTVDRVHKWAQHGAIPARFHAVIIRVGAQRGFRITAENMVALHDQSDEAA